MRQVFAYDAVLMMGQDEDERAPGAGITEALCGSSQHEPPCPLAPHHTTAKRSGEQVHLRVLFAVDPDRLLRSANASIRRLGKALREYRTEGTPPGTL